MDVNVAEESFQNHFRILMWFQQLEVLSEQPPPFSFLFGTEIHKDTQKEPLIVCGIFWFLVLSPNALLILAALLSAKVHGRHLQ